MNYRVLVLDGNERSALAATRALGSAGIAVLTVAETCPSLAGSSRYAKGCRVCPSPYQEPEAFVDALSGILKRDDINVLLPMTDVSTALVLEHRTRFDGVYLPYPEFSVFDRVTNKASLVELAEKVGVRVPATQRVEQLNTELVGSLGLAFPLVLKPVRSKVLIDGQWRSLGVRYIDNPMTLARLIEQEPLWTRTPALLQQRIIGEGRGVFGLYRNGTPMVHFAHRRIRERPPSGGVSVLSESAPLEPEMLCMADTVLSHVGWHGVAMVEFKVDSNGIPYLLEINGRFWGSLQLAIDAGVNFPVLLYHLAVGETIAGAEPYTMGRRSRWLLGDIDWLYLVAKEGNLWERRREVASVLVSLLQVWDTRTRYDVNRWSDLAPFWYELRRYVQSI